MYALIYNLAGSVKDEARAVCMGVGKNKDEDQVNGKRVLLKRMHSLKYWPARPIPRQYFVEN